MALIKSIDSLREYVKINRSKAWDTYAPFVEDAQEKYIVPYFGAELLEIIESSTESALYKKICRALGPFSLALATDELSINFGEVGHTVTKSDSSLPASDVKIERATESLLHRGWANLDAAVKYISAQQTTYPQWHSSELAKKLSSHLFANAAEFQETAMVDIDNSPLTFYRLRMLILRIEKTESLPMLPDPDKLDTYSPKIKEALQAYTGSRVAHIHTSQRTHAERSKPGFRGDMTEFNPLIRPLYSDLDYTGNYFELQADFWKVRLMELLISEGLINPDVHTIKYNRAENRVFVAGAKRDETL